MEIFEYKRINNIPDSKLDNILNLYGSQGWELIYINEKRGLETYNIILKIKLNKAKGKGKWLFNGTT